MRKNNKSVLANFGDWKFYFDFEKYYNDVLDGLIDDILKCEIKIGYNSITHKKTDIEPIILDYLVYNVYGETYQAFVDGEIFKNKNEIPVFHNQSLTERKEIFELIKTKNFTQAIDIINDRFSNSSLCISFLGILFIFLNIFIFN